MAINVSTIPGPHTEPTRDAAPIPPKTIIVELTNVCDLKCPLCTTYVGMRRSTGFMEFGLFRRLIDELAGCLPKPTISMNMSGEPLLHREVDRFVAYAADHGHRTFISTNTTRLDEALAGRLIEAGLSAIHLCVDGATAESHEAYRVGSSFEKVRHNCEGLLQARKRRERSNPFVTIQTLLTAYSENEMREMLDWAWRIGADEVFFKSLSLGSNTSPQQRLQSEHLIPLRPQFRRESLPANTPCKYPAEHTLVYWNGAIGVCCVDFNNMADLGGIQQHGGVLAALRSDEVRAARLRGQRTGFDLCSRCQSVGAGFRGFRVPLHQMRADRRPREDAPDWPRVLSQFDAGTS